MVPCYKKNGIVLVRGKGSKVWDIDGKEYLDLYPGWGVGVLGHSPDKVIQAIAEQAAVLIHVPNNYFHPLQALLAQKIIQTSFPGKCFFCNSGAEAIEGAIKLARLYGSEKGRFEIVSFENSFHGRTIAALTATGQPKYQKGFDPLLPGFRYAKFNDLESVREQINDKTCAVLIEPVQGEGGVYPATEEFLTALRHLCHKNDILLIFDEVQTGMGRTGDFFAFKNYGVIPDIMVLAKGLGGGVPIGAFVARADLADKMQPGTHASTFGGSPLVCAAALKVFDIIEKENMLVGVRRESLAMLERLEEMKKKCPSVKEIRGLGFLIGIEVAGDPLPLIQKCVEQGVLVNRAGENVIRLLPALNILRVEWEKGLAVLESVLRHA